METEDDQGPGISRSVALVVMFAAGFILGLRLHPWGNGGDDLSFLALSEVRIGSMITIGVLILIAGTVGVMWARGTFAIWSAVASRRRALAVMRTLVAPTAGVAAIVILYEAADAALRMIAGGGNLLIPEQLAGEAAPWSPPNWARMLVSMSSIMLDTSISKITVFIVGLFVLAPLVGWFIGQRVRSLRIAAVSMAAVLAIWLSVLTIYRARIHADLQAGAFSTTYRSLVIGNMNMNIMLLAILIGAIVAVVSTLTARQGSFALGTSAGVVATAVLVIAGYYFAPTLGCIYINHPRTCTPSASRFPGMAILTLSPSFLVCGSLAGMVSTGLYTIRRIRAWVPVQ
jgi:hypothetical protein